MTAIAALFAKTGDDAAQRVTRMLEAQHGYGRDSRNMADLGAVAVGRALALRSEEDRHDTQPISFDAGRFTLVADCRIDNRDALARELGVPAAELATMADAALIACAFARWGPDCFDRLRGDFAVAVWDRDEERFILARDVFGNAPLFVHRGDNGIAVSSMPQGLHALPWIERRADADYCARVVAAQGMVSPGSYWCDIDRVLPGHYAFLSRAGLEQHDYWAVPARVPDVGAPAEEAAALRDLIQRAVAVRLRGSSHIAVHLSAGLDSSTVTGAAASALAGRGRVTAFTAVPRSDFADADPGAIFDEGPLAAATARLHANVDHVIIESPADWATRAIDRHFELAQQPAINICNIGWMMAINDAAAARGLRVLMPAALGNFAMSYDGAHALADPLARRDWAEAWRALRAARGGRIAMIKASFWAAMPMVVVRWRQGLRGAGMTGFSAGRQDRAASRLRLFAGQRRYLDVVRAEMARVDPGPERKAALAGWGIDVRDPTCDRDLFDFVAARAPYRFRVGAAARSMIRAAAAGWAAPEVLAEQRRGYQAADWYVDATAHRGWLASEVVALREFIDADALIDGERLAAMIEDWPDGDWHSRAVTESYRFALLRGISMGHFMRRAAGSNR